MLNRNLLVVFFLTPMLSYAIARQHGVYLYDFLYDTNGKKVGHQPGLYATELLQYNASAGPSHALNRLYSYGGDMEMYCHGSGGSDKKTPCTTDKMHVFYGNGAKSTKAYYDAFTQSGATVEMMPVIDGVLNATGDGDYLSALNTLDQSTANLYADKVASLICQDNHVAGVQFDLEPFDMDQPGQAFFYAQIAKDFAGKHDDSGDDPYHCVNEQYPNGRVFSVFTVARKISAKVADRLNRYQNGYVVDPLYDLGEPPKGKALSPADYRRYAAREINAMLQKANQWQVNYQFAIPVAATHHEFEAHAGIPSGFQQLDYVRAAIEAMDEVHARTSTHFKGVTLWTFIQRLDWYDPGYTPARPNDATKVYLASTL